MPPNRRKLAPRRVAGAEPLPGYRLLDRLGGGGYGEVWRCVAPGGIHKAIKFVPGAGESPGPALAQELAALERVKSVRHPFLLGLDRAEVRGPDLLLVMELADKTLQDRLAGCNSAGLPGVPRDELLPLLGEAAEALDVLAGHGLQHLDVKPANLFLVGGHLKVGDFGLVGAVGPWPGAADSLAGVTPKYAAPEVLRGSVSTATDQYGLALAAYELLTGRFTYPTDSARKLVVLHVSGTPDLSAVSTAEAAVLARALAKDPAGRFPSCREFVRRLADAAPAAGTGPVARPCGGGPGDPAARETGAGTAAGVTLPVFAPDAGWLPAPAGLPAARAFDELGRAGPADPRPAAELVLAVVRSCLLGLADAPPGAAGADVTDLFCRFTVRAERAALAEKLKAFAGRWRAAPGPPGGADCVLTVAAPAGWLRRLFGPPEPVRLVVTLPRRRRAGRGEVTAAALGCAGAADPGRHALAVELLRDLRAALADDGDARGSVRYPAGVPAVAYPVDPSGRVGAGSEVRCVDLSAGGARLECAADVPTEHLYLRFPGHPAAPRVGLLCAVVRRAEPGPGHFELGCRFAAG